MAMDMKMKNAQIFVVLSSFIYFYLIHFCLIYILQYF